MSLIKNGKVHCVNYTWERSKEGVAIYLAFKIAKHVPFLFSFGSHNRLMKRLLRFIEIK